MKIFYLSFCILLICQQVMSQDPIAGFIRTNLIGYPVIHDRKTWIFDPDVALKRRTVFVELHGDKGEKLIERLGLGFDGNSEERLKMQRERDAGHLGGLNFYNP